jgi:Zn-dependent protease/predicted transcriptional regulator
MNSRDSIKLGTVSGVPIRIHFTWLFAAAYLIAVFTVQFSRLARAADVADAHLLLPPIVWGILLTLALFACVTLHELGHVFVARRRGARVRSITLMMLGGVSEISDVERPSDELVMAAMGPIVSLLLALGFYGLFRLSSGWPPDLHFGLFYLTQLNLVLGVFNLLPAFPMDGGRVLRSLLVNRLGRLRATQFAATVGKVVAAGLVILAIISANWWLLLIAIFLAFGGDAEVRSLQARAALRGLRVADFYSRKVPWVSADSTAAEAASAMLSQAANACIVLADGRPTGVVTASDVSRIPVRERANVPVLQVTRRADPVSVTDDVPTVLSWMNESQVEAVPVVDHEQLVGMLSLEDIARALQLRDLAAMNV